MFLETVSWYLLYLVLPLRLINKLQPGSVKKINLSQWNWSKVIPILITGLCWDKLMDFFFFLHRYDVCFLWYDVWILFVNLTDSVCFSCSWQLENIGNFIKAILAYGLKPSDIFEATDLFESGNMTQVQTTLLALASMVREHSVQRLNVS